MYESIWTGRFGREPKSLQYQKGEPHNVQGEKMALPPLLSYCSVAAGKRLPSSGHVGRELKDKKRAPLRRSEARITGHREKIQATAEYKAPFPHIAACFGDVAAAFATTLIVCTPSCDGSYESLISGRWMQGQLCKSFPGA